MQFVPNIYELKIPPNVKQSVKFKLRFSKIFSFELPRHKWRGNSEKYKFE